MPTLLLIWIILFAVIIPQQNRQRMLKKLMIMKRKKGEKTVMKELAQGLTDKKCIFYLFNGSQISGFIKEVTENAVLLTDGSSTEVVNLEFVMRIREIPKNKKGKYKNFC